MNKIYSLLVLVIAFSVVLSFSLAFEPLVDSPTGFHMLDLVMEKASLGDFGEKVALSTDLGHDVESDDGQLMKGCQTDEDCDPGEECVDNFCSAT